MATAMAMKFELQEHLGKYPIIREIGSGATSRVYLARDPFADREVAIKVFLFDENINPQTERMMHKAFLAEAALAGKLNHPHIVEILDAVVEPEHSYLVMEYVPGTTLEAHSDVTNLLPLNKVVEIIFKCIRALEYAFQHGVIHRDIKPGNILLSESGDTKVSDFGASFQQRHGQETTQLTGVGSPAYMSPEQIHGRRHPPDRYLFAGRGDVPDAHRPAALRSQYAGGSELRHSQHRPGPAGDLASGPVAAARPDRHEGDRERSRRPAQDLARIRQGAQPGLHHAAPFRRIGLRFGEVQRSARHAVFRGLRRRRPVGGRAHRQLEAPGRGNRHHPGGRPGR